MIPTDYINLVEQLITKGSSNEVKWESTSDETQFIVYLEKFSISVKSHWSHSEPENIDFILRNNDGELVDQFCVFENEEQWSIIGNLYSIARRKALQIDDAINSIMDELNSDGEVGGNNPDDGIPF